MLRTFGAVILALVLFLLLACVILSYSFHKDVKLADIYSTAAYTTATPSTQVISPP